MRGVGERSEKRNVGEVGCDETGKESCEEGDIAVGPPSYSMDEWKNNPIYLSVQRGSRQFLALSKYLSAGWSRRLTRPW